MKAFGQPGMKEKWKAVPQVVLGCITLIFQHKGKCWSQVALSGILE